MSESQAVKREASSEAATFRAAGGTATDLFSDDDDDSDDGAVANGNAAATTGGGVKEDPTGDGGDGGGGGDANVTVRAMSNVEVFFYLDEALSEGGSGGGRGGQRKELEKLKDTLGHINPMLAAKDKLAVFTALKANLQKWSAKAEAEGLPPKRLTAEQIARFIDFNFEDPSQYTELCRNAEERAYFTNDELADIIDIVQQASS